MAVIPVARVAGGAGGSGREGTDESDDQGCGFGTGFGMGANPIDLREVRDGRIAWKPVIDVNRTVLSDDMTEAGDLRPYGSSSWPKDT